jgi:chromosome segregation ATPase
MPESHEMMDNVHIPGTRPLSYHHDGLRNSEYVELIDEVNIGEEVATKYDYESKSTETNWRETKEGREEEQRQIRELQKVVHRGLESAEREAKDCLEEAKASREEYNRKLKALSADNSVLEEKMKAVEICYLASKKEYADLKIRHADLQKRHANLNKLDADLEEHVRILKKIERWVIVLRELERIVSFGSC